MALRQSFFLILSMVVLGVFPFAAMALHDITELAQSILDLSYVILTIIFILALVVFGWGIVKYLYAAGDANKIKDARQILWWGILGLFVLAAIYGLVSFIARNLDITVGGGVLAPPRVREPK